MRNDAADELANEGSRLNQENTSWTYNSSKSAIRRYTRKRRIHEDKHAMIYEKENGSTKYPHHSGQRSTQVLGSRLRSGHHPDLRYWRHKLGLEDSDKCRLCDMDIETGHHVICECPALQHYRPVAEDPHNIIHNDEKIRLVWEKWKDRTMVE